MKQRKRSVVRPMVFALSAGVGGLLGAIPGTVATSSAAVIDPPPPPRTSIVLPANGATVSGSTWLDATATAHNAIKSVVFEVSGGSLSDDVVASGTATIYGYLGDWDTTDVPNGTYTLQSVATDATGQSARSAGVTVTVDNPTS